MRISDWSSDVCSSDLAARAPDRRGDIAAALAQLVVGVGRARDIDGRPVFGYKCPSYPRSGQVAVLENAFAKVRPRENHAERIERRPGLDRAAADHAALRKRPRDRQSTRLNSSH